MLLLLRSLDMLPLKADTVSLSILCWEKPMKLIFLKREFVSSLRRYLFHITLNSKVRM